MHGVDERPRAICNTADVGFVQIWQSAAFGPIKEILPGFVQGLPKKEMENLFKKGVKDCSKKTNERIMATSKDGSAFDGNQKGKVREAIAKEMFEVFKDTLIKWWF